MDMKRIINVFSIVVLFCLCAAARPAGDWKVYSTFNDWHKRVIDTKDRVYLVTLCQPTLSWLPSYNDIYSSLFVYDKESDEIEAWNQRNRLSGNTIQRVAYNPSNDCLIVVYSDSNIDFIYGNGDVINVPGIVNASITFSKKVNGINIDQEKDRVYFATDFGYVVVDAKKHEVVSSVVGDFPVKSAARVGEFIVLLNDTGAFFAPSSKQVLRIEDFKQIQGIRPSDRIMPLNGNSFAYIISPASDFGNNLCVSTLNSDGTASVDMKKADNFNEVALMDGGGYYIDCYNNIYTLSSDGVLQAGRLPEHTNGICHNSLDMKTFWVIEGRSGMRAYRKDGDSWSLFRDFIFPNAPSTFICQDIEYSDRFGAVAVEHGMTRQFVDWADLSTSIATFKNGEWTDRSLARTNPDRQSVLRNATGMEFDPVNPSVIVRGSRTDGVSMINLDDPQQIVHLSVADNPDNGKPGFYTVFSPHPTQGPAFAGISPPGFDAEGTLWFARSGSPVSLYYWKAADRKALNTGAIGSFALDNNKSTSYLILKPLKAGVNKNLLFYAGNGYGYPLGIVDHNGTPDDTADDKEAFSNSLKDQDDARVACHLVYALYEDMQTGLLWVGSDVGLFTINPRKFLSDNGKVNRIKVARNDGTNLADYLLNGVGVNDITSDSQGRKWFATMGGGLVCTSSDGREIIYQLTTENSFIPHDNVYAVCCIPSTNSVLISTEGGMAEFFPAGSASGADLDSMKAYPNPVRPDYLGWITVEGLTEGAVVKIMDSMGGLVKELGPAEGGVVQWDATNLSHQRVGSGVYYVLASSGPGETNLAKVTKILVVR